MPSPTVKLPRKRKKTFWKPTTSHYDIIRKYETKILNRKYVTKIWTKKIGKTAGGFLNKNLRLS